MSHKKEILRNTVYGHSSKSRFFLNSENLWFLLAGVCLTMALLLGVATLSTLLLNPVAIVNFIGFFVLPMIGFLTSMIVLIKKAFGKDASFELKHDMAFKMTVLMLFTTFLLLFVVGPSTWLFLSWQAMMILMLGPIVTSLGCLIVMMVCIYKQEFSSDSTRRLSIKEFSEMESDEEDEKNAHSITCIQPERTHLVTTPMGPTNSGTPLINPNDEKTMPSGVGQKAITLPTAETAGSVPAESVPAGSDQSSQAAAKTPSYGPFFMPSLQQQVQLLSTEERDIEMTVIDDPVDSTNNRPS